MASDATGELVNGLKEAHAMEMQSVRLLEAAEKIAGDEEIAAIYRAHLLQTQEHVRYVEERLDAYGEGPSKVKDAARQAGALGIGATLKLAPKTPVMLASAATAVESLEAANYKLLLRVAERVEDTETIDVVKRILEQEEAAAELVAGTFDRALEITLGEEPRAPVPSVTPIGKPSERSEGLSKHPGPQQAHEHSPDEPVAPRGDISDPTEGSHMESPDPGHPARDVDPESTTSSRS